jgi:hypothetical protein
MQITSSEIWKLKYCMIILKCDLLVRVGCYYSFAGLGLNVMMSDE